MTNQCSHVLKNGNRCKKTSNVDTKCHIHKSNNDDKHLCGGKGRDGPCVRKVSEHGEKCIYHGGEHKKERVYVRCGAKASRGPCKQKLFDGKPCRYHGVKKKEIIPNNDDHEKELCPLCDTPEVWKWMKSAGFSKYEISSLGKIFNIQSKKSLGRDEFMFNSNGYERFALTNDDGSHKTKNVNTFQGIIFFGIKAMYGDDKSEITLDHVNRERDKNYTCCNLVPATWSEQNKNKGIRLNRSGRKVLRLSDEGEVLEEYISVVQAAKSLHTDKAAITRHCHNGEKYEGNNLKYFDKEDFKGELKNQKWKSTTDLYPKIKPPIEISNMGWVRRHSGRISQGTETSTYFYITARNDGQDKTFNISVHVLVWEIFSNKRVPEGLEISHKNRDGKDNRFINLEATTHLKNVMTSVLSGKNKSCIPVRQHFHDGTYKDHVSIGQAARITLASPSTIENASLGIYKTSVKCKCGKKCTWERI